MDRAALERSVLVVDCDGLLAVTAPWVPPRRCARCGYATRSRWHEFGTRKLHALHAECLRAWRRRLDLEAAG